MKILHVCAGWSPFNGAARIALRIAREQRRQGHEVSFAAWAKPSALRSADEVWMHCGWMPCLMWAGIFARRGVRVPEACYDPVRLAWHGWKKRLAGPFERFFLRRASRIVATCPEEKRWIQDYVGPHCPPVEVLDARRLFFLRPRGGAGRGSPVARAASGENPPRVLYMGRRHPLKGLDVLEEAVSRIPGARLEIVSDAQGAEKDAAFARCDVFCLPTLSDNFGIVVAEALERGCPAIVTDGAPAWKDEPALDADGNVRLVYVEGFRAASRGRRVELLADALARFARGGRPVKSSTSPA